MTTKKKTAKKPKARECKHGGHPTIQEAIDCVMKPKAKKAAVVWERSPWTKNDWEASVGGVKVDAYPAATDGEWIGMASSKAGNAARYTLGSLKAAKAAALDLAKLVKRWGKR